MNHKKFIKNINIIMFIIRIPTILISFLSMYSPTILIVAYSSIPNDNGIKTVDLVNTEYISITAVVISAIM